MYFALCQNFSLFPVDYHLNAISKPSGHRDFLVSVRSVRDRINLVLIKKYKKEMADEVKASGIAVELLSEFDRAMEEICPSTGKDMLTSSTANKALPFRR